MSRSGRNIVIAGAAVILTGAMAAAQEPVTVPAAFDVDEVILAPFLTETSSSSSSRIDSDAAAVAAGVIAETGSDNASLNGFASQSMAVSEFHDGSRLEFRLYQPTLLTRSDRLFDPQSDIDPAIVIPGRQTGSSVSVDYVTRFDSPGGADGLDLTIEPRAGLSFGPEGSGAGAGAQVRLGRYLQEDAARPSWYFFAGAERRALLYDPGQGWNMRGAMTLEPYAVVGDAQAGVAMRLGDNDLSFAYVRRERSARIGIDDYDAADDFAAFSLSRRW